MDCTRGATALEHALLAAILGLGIISAAGLLSDKIYNLLNATAAEIAK